MAALILTFGSVALAVCCLSISSDVDRTEPDGTRTQAHIEIQIGPEPKNEEIWPCIEACNLAEETYFGRMVSPLLWWEAEERD